MTLIRPQLGFRRLACSCPHDIPACSVMVQMSLCFLTPTDGQRAEGLDRDSAAKSFQNQNSIGKHLALQPHSWHLLTRPFILGKLTFKGLFQVIFLRDREIQQDTLFGSLGQQDDICSECEYGTCRFKVYKHVWQPLLDLRSPADDCPVG